MVGVPGRSKGCNTCRQRKIACDQQKPQCRQCVKSSRLCMGYQRERIFIHSQGTGQKCFKIYSKEPLCERQGNRIAEAEQNTKKKDRRGRPTCVRDSQSMIVKTVSPHLIYRQQLLSEFLIRYKLVSSSAASRYDTIEDRPAAWLRHLPELSTRTKALELSILALSTAKLGRLNNNMDLVGNSLKFYVQGLSELQKTLWNSDLMGKDETLAACMVLSLYESIECPAKTHYGWLSHLHGCTKLIQMRGPEAHASALGHELFLSFRLREIAQAITQRRSTYLSDTAWIELPWQNFPKTPIHKLLDIITALPSLIEQGYHMRELAITERLLSSMAILKRCWKVDEELRQFFDELEKSHGPLFWPEPSKEESPADDAQSGKVFPVAFHFSNPRMANICMLYWASLIILWSGLSYVYKLLATMEVDEKTPTSFTSCCESTSSCMSGHDAVCMCKDKAQKSPITMSNMENLLPLKDQEDVVSLSRNICQSVEYCLNTEVQGLGPGFVYLSLKVAIETFIEYPGCSRELLWAESAMERANSSGVRLLKFVGVTLSQKAYAPI